MVRDRSQVVALAAAAGLPEALMIVAAISPWDVRLPWRNVPVELWALSQWVTWRYAETKGGNTKVPYVASGRYPASSTNPTDWTTFEQVCAAADIPDHCDGIGYVFVHGQGYCGIDLDHIWDGGDADEGPDWAAGILDRFADSYAEASPSTTGYKIWCRATLPGKGRKWEMGAGRKIELYDSGRFFTMTGRSNGVPVITDHQADVEALIQDLDGMQPRPCVPAAERSHPSGHQHHQNDPRLDIPFSEHYEHPQRHSALVRAAGWWWGLGLSAGEVFQRLHHFNAAYCHPPKPAAEVNRIISDMERSWPR
jgi:hypothetical protein